MKKIKEIKWDEFKILEIFSISPGIRLTKADMLEGDTPFIGATDSNNGITAFCGNDNESRDNNVLGVNYNGSIVENFYHPYSALFSDDVKRLHVKNVEGNKYIYLFLKQCILKQKSKYEYGYKFNGERMKDQIILLPVCEDGSPNFVYMESYMKKLEKKILSRYKKYIDRRQQGGPIERDCMEEHKWKEFDVQEVFSHMMRGRRLKTDDHIPGKIPYVSSSAMDNGVDNFVSNEKGVRIFNNCLTIANSGSVGATFYHPYSFVASDHVTSLANPSFDKYIYLFGGEIMNRLSEKYSFNREIKDSRLRREKIMLPVNEKDEPDYDYMGKYMRKIEHRLIKRYVEKRLKTLEAE
ncbi:MAG: restriction endonuclease subunit S [Bacteroidales bacterium]|nr:restriction endonuclease subunit S [Bacteroidales bacterium]